MAWMGAVGAAAIGGLAGIMGQNSANSTNMQIAQMNNNTAIDLANTSYQRRVTDLQAAGLNPMLAYTQGGAAVPNLQQATVQNSLAGVGPAVSSAYDNFQKQEQAKLNDAQVQTQVSQQNLNKALATKAQADADAATASADEATVRTQQYGPAIEQTLAQIHKIATDTGLSNAQTTLVKANAVNAILTGKQIQANTGNIEADTRLKNVKTTLEFNKFPASNNAAEAAASPVGQFGAYKRELFK